MKTSIEDEVSGMAYYRTRLSQIYTDTSREQHPQCRSCRNTLDRSLDYKKNRHGWWTNCRSCRDERTDRRRQQKAVQLARYGESQRRNAAGTECSVCADMHVEQDLVRLSGCNHKPDVCRACFIQWLETQLENTTWENMQCPSSGCGQSITHEDVRMHAPGELFTRFDELSIRALLSNDPNFRYCLAEGCNSGQIHITGTDGNIFRCTACGFLVCTVHDVAFHTNQTCAQYDEQQRKQQEEKQKRDLERAEQDELSTKEIKASTSNCPGCHVPIHKYEACDHITCSRCKFEFCYLCRAPYRGKDGIWTIGNIAHSQECDYHPKNLHQKLERRYNR